MSRRIISQRRVRYLYPGSVLAGCLLTSGLLAGALAGCASPAPDLGSDAAKQLHSQVLAVTEAAAADDSAGSLKLLDELTTTLDEAAAGGDVSFKRHQSIRTSIDAVRADLTAKQAAAEAARVAAEQEAATAAGAADPAPAVVAPAPGNNADKPKGKGKG